MTTADVAVLDEVGAFLRGPRGLLIDGEVVESADGATFETLNPATGQPIVDVAEAKSEDIDRAVKSARRALEGPWSTMPPTERGRLISRLADLIAENADELAQLEALDNGKPVMFARLGDVALASDHFRYFSGWPSKIYGDTLPVGIPDMHAYTRKEPVGVVGAIIAWNFPLPLASWKLGPALAAGCTVVLKPAEQTPLTALRLGELVLEAGIPPGVVNVCPGFGETAGAALVEHPGVDMITFTGSVPIGIEIAQRAATTLKHVALELGGKSPNVVLPDADLAAAAEGSANAIFFNSGQVCCAGSRLMVQRDVFDEVVEGVVAAAGAHKVGPGINEDTTLGPLVSAAQHARVTGFIDQAVSDGASIAVGGGRPEGLSPDGYFVEPTVIVDVPDDMTIAREEVFGPVVVAQPFDTLEELAARANDTNFGLAAGIWTKDVSKAHKVAALLQAGTVWINCWNQFDAAAPFGGYKHSGYGRDAGKEALEKYLQTKTVWTSLA
jgi:acyl-CoA reductase-like NAD-dependent aldehyde dehydrogenase